MRTHHIYQVEFLNCTFLVYGIHDDWGIDDVVLSQIKNKQDVESDTLCWWVAIVEAAKRGAVVLDIGAYTGFYSLIACARNPWIRCISAEASVTTYSRLVQNVQLNRFDIRIIPNHLAISDRCGVAELCHAYGITTMASGESLAPDYGIDHSELVPTISLDALLLQSADRPTGVIASKALGMLPITAVSGMKIDVEGVEFAVLRGAQQVLRTFKPSLIIEILSSARLSECDGFLSGLGYERLAQCRGQNFIYAASEKCEIISAAHAALTTATIGSGSFELIDKISFSF